MSKQNSKNKKWAVSDVNFVEVEIARASDQQMRVEFSCGVSIVIANEQQIPLAAKLIEALRDGRETNGREDA